MKSAPKKITWYTGDSLLFNFENNNVIPVCQCPDGNPSKPSDYVLSGVVPTNPKEKYVLRQCKNCENLIPPNSNDFPPVFLAGQRFPDRYFFILHLNHHHHDP